MSLSKAGLAPGKQLELRLGELIQVLESFQTNMSSSIVMGKRSQPLQSTLEPLPRLPRK